MEKTDLFQGIEKLETGIEGFDLISYGGLPKGRTTLVAGTAGSAKTMFSVHFLAAGIFTYNQSGVFITFEEPPRDIRTNMSALGWNIEEWEKENKWAFVDASPGIGEEAAVIGNYDLGALLARIESAIRKTGAKRVAIDSLGSLFSMFREKTVIRHELFRIATALKEMEVTTIITSERKEEYGDIARFGVEEYVTDNVIILRNVLEAEKRRRTLEILKYRGANHQKGEFPFSILSDKGVVVIPLSAIELKQQSSNKRITAGNKEVDEMCGGGFFRDSVVLVSGATGTGKTLMTTEFINGGTIEKEKCMLLAFEESREQLFRNAQGWGVDYHKLEKKGRLLVHCEYPEIASLEDHLIMVKDLIEDFKPKRVALDSLSALERISTVKGFREFIISLTSFIKHEEGEGMHIGKPFRNISGILSGNPQHIAQGEMDRLGSMFTE